MWKIWDQKCLHSSILQYQLAGKRKDSQYMILSIHGFIWTKFKTGISDGRFLDVLPLLMFVGNGKYRSSWQNNKHSCILTKASGYLCESTGVCVCLADRLVKSLFHFSPCNHLPWLRYTKNSFGSLCVCLDAVIWVLWYGYIVKHSEYLEAAWRKESWGAYW